MTARAEELFNWPMRDSPLSMRLEATNPKPYFRGSWKWSQGVLILWIIEQVNTSIAWQVTSTCKLYWTEPRSLFLTHSRGSSSTWRTGAAEPEEAGSISGTLPGSVTGIYSGIFRSLKKLDYQTEPDIVVQVGGILVDQLSYWSTKPRKLAKSHWLLAYCNWLFRLTT